MALTQLLNGNKHENAEGSKGGSVVPVIRCIRFGSLSKDKPKLFAKME